MTPPTSSAFDLYFAPNTFPTFNPIAERMNVVAPMNSTAATIFTSGSNAKVIPTARASILVAMASRSIVLKLNEASSFSSSFDSASLIILPPIRQSSTNAIQWSTAVIYCSKVEPKR